MSEFPGDNQAMSGLSTELSATPDGATINGVSSSRSGDVAAMIENFQTKKTSAGGGSGSSMLNRINSNVVPVPGSVVVSSVAGSPGTIIVSNNNPATTTTTQLVSSTSSSSRVKRSSQVYTVYNNKMCAVTQCVPPFLMLPRNFVAHWEKSGRNNGDVSSFWQKGKRIYFNYTKKISLYQSIEPIGLVPLVFLDGGNESRNPRRQILSQNFQLASSIRALLSLSTLFFSSVCCCSLSTEINYPRKMRQQGAQLAGCRAKNTGRHWSGRLGALL